jgi:hypothetical protein
VSAEIHILKERLNQTGSLRDALALRKAQLAPPPASDDELKEMAADALASSAGIWKFFTEMVASGRDVEINIVKREYSADELKELAIT